ncbi:hypothetical protein EYF80_010402 [Liparis tanakae]|uniref:Uncharacterized protein n=1 Tax=Liparis tanakae TaxID=230148 RepID=A0A4Z2INZ5_9TELE|nr:hypothetical protein EYF80_010402 [Liparis tanakae]
MYGIKKQRRRDGICHDSSPVETVQTPKPETVTLRVAPDKTAGQMPKLSKGKDGAKEREGKATEKNGMRVGRMKGEVETEQDGRGGEKELK